MISRNITANEHIDILLVINCLEDVPELYKIAYKLKDKPRFKIYTLISIFIFLFLTFKINFSKSPLRVYFTILIKIELESISILMKRSTNNLKVNPLDHC